MGELPYIQGHWNTLQASQLGRKRLHLICRCARTGSETECIQDGASQSNAPTCNNHATDLSFPTGLAIHRLARLGRHPSRSQTVDAHLWTRHDSQWGVAITSARIRVKMAQGAANKVVLDGEEIVHLTDAGCEKGTGSHICRATTQHIRSAQRRRWSTWSWRCVAWDNPCRTLDPFLLF